MRARARRRESSAIIPESQVGGWVHPGPQQQQHSRVHSSSSFARQFPLRMTDIFHCAMKSFVGKVYTAGERRRRTRTVDGRLAGRSLRTRVRSYNFAGRINCTNCASWQNPILSLVDAIIIRCAGRFNGFHPAIFRCVMGCGGCGAPSATDINRSKSQPHRLISQGSRRKMQSSAA